MSIEKQVVEQIATQNRNTKFGVKPVYSFKVGGAWYQTGFTRHNLNVGDVVSFSFTVDTYGNQVDAKAIRKEAASAAVGTNVPVAAVPAVRAAAPTSSGGKGVFPIPALDGQRSIVRQNALTNARELLTDVLVRNGTTAFSGADTNAVAKRIIEVARIFESYTTGDMDMEEVKDEMAKEAKAKKAA